MQRTLDIGQYRNVDAHDTYRSRLTYACLASPRGKRIGLENVRIREWMGIQASWSARWFGDEPGLPFRIRLLPYLFG
jgi:hypothetical protein